MLNSAQKRVHKYLRTNKNFPHVWCAGCSIGITLGTIIRAVDDIGFKNDEMVMVSGIGCSSRMPVYVDFNTLHTLHGRGIAFATGIKMFKPKLKVMVVTGDGDATAIGGNHFIHAARRNLDITVILINNNIYGMTGGQYSPTTPKGDNATTAQHGNIDPDFDICKLAIGAGATYVARSTAYHAIEAQKMIKEALLHPGFSLVEIISACPTYFGKMNKKGTGPEMMRDMKDNSITIKALERLPKDKADPTGKIIRGVFVQDTKAEYTASYQKMVDKLSKKEK
ncbi:MAG: thiamine pyrophosphate-dependent enzyme [Candidatus Cloacimonadota bacterium]|nr:thiamine pyrophosphate-dependent enzyme [Candidatus Cloacimonadota bacterium]